jgi:V/A-type H+-transporting ATPase subunit E
VHGNARDANEVRAIVGGNFGGTIDCLGGVVIESADGTTRLDLTFDSLLHDLWDDVVKEVATTLWPRK